MDNNDVTTETPTNDTGTIVASIANLPQKRKICKHKHDKIKPHDISQFADLE